MGSQQGALSKAYKVPETTLRDQIKGRVSVSAVVGQKPILTEEEEDKLEEDLIDCCGMGVEKTKKQLKEK